MNLCFFVQVQLLISAQDVENYKLIKADLDRLRTLVEKSELWVEKKSSGGGDGKKDKKDKGQVGSVDIKKKVKYLLENSQEGDSYKMCQMTELQRY